MLIIKLNEKELTDNYDAILRLLNEENTSGNIISNNNQKVSEMAGKAQNTVPAVDINNISENARSVPAVNIGNLITVKGNIDSTNIKQMENIANKAVDRLVTQMSDGIRYRNL